MMHGSCVYADTNSSHNTEGFFSKHSGINLGTSLHALTKVFMPIYPFLFVHNSWTNSDEVRLNTCGGWAWFPNNQFLNYSNFCLSTYLFYPERQSVWRVSR